MERTVSNRTQPQKAYEILHNNDYVFPSFGFARSLTLRLSLSLSLPRKWHFNGTEDIIVINRFRNM